jgi:restriction system protein
MVCVLLWLSWENETSVSSFQPGALQAKRNQKARTKETRKLTLLDLEKLVDLWVINYEKIEDSDKQLLPLKRVYYLAPSG